MKPLTEKEISMIEHMSDTRFDCAWWGSANVRKVIKELLAHIRHQESEAGGQKGIK